MEVASNVWPAAQPDDMDHLQFLSQANGMQSLRSTDPTLPTSMADASTQEALMQMSPVFDLSMNDNSMDSVFGINSNPFVAGMPNANTTLLGDSYLMGSPQSSSRDLNDLFDADYPHQFESHNKTEQQSLVAPMHLDSTSSRFAPQSLHLDTYLPFDSPPEATESDLSWSLSSPESQQGFLDDSAGLLEMSTLDEALSAQVPATTSTTDSPPAHEAKLESKASARPYQTRKRKESSQSATSDTSSSTIASAKDQKTDAAPRKRRTRRSKPLSEEQKKQKHERFLANNREAACKCRQKKKAAENKLVDDAKSLEAAVELRRVEFFRLQSEFQALKKEWEKHSNCKGIDHRASISGAVENIRATTPISSPPESSDKSTRNTRAKSLPI